MSLTCPRVSQIFLLVIFALASAGCERDTTLLDPAPANDDPLVFGDDFGDAVDYQAFLSSKLDAVQIDPTGGFNGSPGLLITVPEAGHPTDWFSGGAFTTAGLRDLSGYNALTFRARASADATLDVVGLGNDNTGTSKFTAEWRDIPLTTSWQSYVMPIPLAEKLTAEGGLFFFAEGPEDAVGYEIRFDDVQFESDETISDPRPILESQTIDTFAGDTLSIQGAEVTFDVDGTDQTIAHMPGYLTFSSSDTSVVRVENGLLLVVGGGTATIEATLGAVPVEGSVVVTSTGTPTEAAPTPGFAPGDVISLFSDAYDDVPVVTWSAEWDAADVTQASIAGDAVKVFTNLVYAGIEFTSPSIDASAMTHFHMDAWFPAGETFKMKLVDFGSDDAYGGSGDAADTEHELTFTAATTPAIVTGEWVELDIPLADFSTLAGRFHLSQLVLSGDAATVYIDNVFFHK